MKVNKFFLNGKKVKLLPIFIALVVLFSGTAVYLFRAQIFADSVTTTVTRVPGGSLRTLRTVVHNSGYRPMSDALSQSAGVTRYLPGRPIEKTDWVYVDPKGTLIMTRQIFTPSNSTPKAVAEQKEQVARRSVRTVAAVSHAVFATTNAAVPRTLSPEERVQAYIEMYSPESTSGTFDRVQGVNNYASEAILNMYNGGIQDLEAFNLLKTNPTKYGLKEGFTDNFTKLDNAMKFINAYGGGEKGLIAWANLEHDAQSKGTSIAEGTTSKDALAYLIQFPNYFGLQPSMSATLQNASPNLVEYSAMVSSGTGATVTEADLNSSENDAMARAAAAYTIGDLPAPSTPLIQPADPVVDAYDDVNGNGIPDFTESGGSLQSGAAAATSTQQSAATAATQQSGATPRVTAQQSTASFMDQFVRAGVKVGDGLTDETVTASLDAAATTFNQTGDAQKAYDSFIASITTKGASSFSDPDHLARFKEEMGAMGTDGAGKLMILLKPSQVKSLLTGNIKDLSLMSTSEALQDAADLFTAAGIMTEKLDPFGIYTLRGDTSEFGNFSRIMKLGIGSGYYAISEVDVANQYYKLGGKAAGDFALAAYWGGGDPSTTDLILNFMATDDKAGTDATFGDYYTRVRDFVKNDSGAYRLVKTISKTSMGIDPSTGGVAYTSTVKRWVDGANGKPGDFVDAGYISYDPINNRYYGDLTAELAGKEVRLYSHPRTGVTYMSVSNTDDKALAGVGGNMLKLMSVSVGQNGKIGGSFKLANRLFTYNPETSAFEVKIRDLLGDSMSKNLPNGIDLTVDSKGHVSGSYNLFGGKTDANGNVTSKSNGALFFDSDGNAGFTYSLKSSDGKGYLAGVSVDIKGNISGSINLGKEIFGKDLFVSFGKGGITGVSVPIGSFGVGINKSGGISLSYAIPIAGIPIPISLSQDAHGNFGIGIPFVGTILKLGSENRDLSPPEIQKSDDGNSRLECIFFYHSFKKLFQTVRVWNTNPSNKCPLQIDSKEQIARSNKIFYVYNRLVGRNPSYQEFYSWYFYSAGNLAQPSQYAFEYGGAANSDYRTIQLESAMRGLLAASQEYKYKSSLVLGSNSATQAVAGSVLQRAFSSQSGKIVEVKAPTDMPKTEDIMPYNPFDPDQVAKYQEEQQKAAVASGATSAATGGTTLDPFFKAIESQASADPYYSNGVYNIPASDKDTLIQSSISSVTATASGSMTATSSESPVAAESPTSSDDVVVNVTNEGKTAEQLDAETKENMAENGIQTSEKLNNLSVTIRPGFNTVYVPRDDASWSVEPFKSKGLVVYDFNSDGSKSWRLSSKNQVSIMKPGFGYYVYNPDQDEAIVIVSVAGIADVRPLRTGWNLLANSTSLYAKLTDMLYKVPKPDQPKCAKAGCMMQISLFEYFNKTIAQNLAYKNLFVIKDSAATTADKAFETIEVTAENADNIVFAPGDIFWLYQWK